MRKSGIAALVSGAVLATVAAALWVKKYRSKTQVTMNSAGVKLYEVKNLIRLPQFCHAAEAGGLLFVSGSLGVPPNSRELVKGGLGPQTKQTMENIELILKEAGLTVAHLVKVNIYLKDNSRERFTAMNEAYTEFFEQRKDTVFGDALVPARITVGCGHLALGADVEIDAVAKM